MSLHLFRSLISLIRVYRFQCTVHALFISIIYNYVGYVVIVSIKKYNHFLYIDLMSCELAEFANF